MCEPARAAVSLIHGARRPFESHQRNRPWMADLAAHLAARGFGPVEPYRWSGGYLRSYLGSEHRAYAESVASLWDRERRQHGARSRLHVFAKSNGAHIAERALRHLHALGRSLHVGVFLRVATADPRPEVHLPNVDHVVTVTSAADRLHATGSWVALAVFRGHYPGAGGRPTPQTRIEIDGLSHEDFNASRPVSVDGYRARTTYDLYAEILGADLR